MSRRNIIILILALAALTAGAQEKVTLQGSIQDSFLERGLFDCTVSLMRADSTAVECQPKVYEIGNDEMHISTVFYIDVPRQAANYIIRVQKDGYEDGWAKVSVPDGYKEKMLAVPMVNMKKSIMKTVGLNEVVVKATRIKVKMRGDTLVYDATAFKLPQGSMLDDLIRQMPGVTLNEAGQIFVNGRMVDELMLGSRSFMKGNKKVLMENLPYYTVKDIKVYDRQSDKSMALGYDVDPKKFVMDVNLKEEYQRGYIANVEGAVGTEDRWLGRAFLLGFTDRLRLTLFGNVNNVNESRHIGQSGHWTPASMPQSMVTTRSAATEIDYHTKGDKVKETFSTDYTSTTDEQEMRQRYEQFLAGSTPLSISAMRNRSGNRQVKLHNNLSVSKPLYLGTELEFNYATRDGSFNSSFDQWNDSLTASKRTVGMSVGKAWNVKADIGGAVNVGKNKQHVDYHFTFAHNYDESQQASRYLTEQFTSDSRQLTHNTSDIYNRQTIGFVNLGYGMPLGKDIRLSFIDQAQIVNRRTHDYLYHPDTLLLPSEIDMLTAITDPSNSYDSHSHMFENSARVSLYQTAKCKPYPDLPMSMEYQRWDIALSLPVRHERLDYERGMIDTVATQNTVFLNVSASYRLVSKDGKHDLRLSASHNRSSAQLMSRIGWRDDSQPLIVREGNPGLKGNVTTNANIDYFDKNAHGHQQSFHVGTSLNYQHRSTAQSVAYDPASGVYTYRPQNVSGAYTLKGVFDISRTIDKNRYWTWQTNADAGYHHSIDHAMLTGMTASEENVVNTLTLHDGAYIQYNKGSLNVRATGDIRWRHSEGKMQDFETLNATDFQYGLSARYTLPRLNTTLSADGNMYSRRGYGSSELNTDDFVLNASISQPFFKGKLIARIEAFDLLHQLSNTQYTVNAQGRTETWYRSLPHYVMAHLVYHWNKNPKKK